MVLSLVLSWLLLKRIAVMPLVTGVVVLIFGGLTLWLHDDTFIKMKPTVINSLFGAVLLGGLLFGQSLLQYVFGDVYKLSPQGWIDADPALGPVLLLPRHPQRSGVADRRAPTSGWPSRSGRRCR